MWTHWIACWPNSVIVPVIYDSIQVFLQNIHETEPQAFSWDNEENKYVSIKVHKNNVKFQSEGAMQEKKRKRYKHCLNVVKIGEDDWRLTWIGLINNNIINKQFPVKPTSSTH